MKFVTEDAAALRSYDALVLERFMLFAPEALPAQLADRAVVLMAVVLRDDETPAMFGERLVWPVDRDDVAVLRLLAAGESTRSIASRTGVSLRTAQRQVARIRRRFGGDHALDNYLRERGLGHP